MSEFYRLKILFEQNFIQQPQNFSHPFYISVLFETIILFDDLLQKIKKISRIDFSDEIPKDEDLYGDGFNDITDLIRYYRNSFCHIDNNKRKFQENVFSIIMSIGIDSAIKVDGKIIGSKFHDDACIILGSKQLYLKRHIERTFKELILTYKMFPEFRLEMLF